MEIDQLLFKYVVKLFSKSADDIPNAAHRVELTDMHNRLSLIARALSSESIEILPSEREGGWHDFSFFMPRTISLYDSKENNEALYLFRVFYLHTQRMLNLNWESKETQSIKASQKEALLKSSIVLESLFEEYPNTKELHDRLLTKLPFEIHKKNEGPVQDQSWLYGRFMKNSPGYENRKDLENVSDEIFNEDGIEKQSEKPTTEIEAKSADEVKILQVDKKAQGDFMLTHNFEKVDTVDEFNGVWRDFDGDDDLADQAEAMQEYNLSQLVRVDDPVHSIYKAEFRGDTSIAESASGEEEGSYHFFPEWDYKKRQYKPDFCKLFYKKILSEKPEYYYNTIEQNRATLLELQKTFARFNNEREVIRRQPHGDEIDLDAAVDLYADIKAKRTPNERVYLYKKQSKKELSMLILLDLSLSSDGYVFGNRILDVEKQVSLLFGEVLNEYEIDFQIDGFYSKTRNNITYVGLKAFDQKWDIAKLRVGAIQPQGYTRIGPAIRHASTLLSKRSSQKKWLIMLSDGKPNDYDRYEGRYGIEDIKQSLRELEADGIQSYALAIEEQAKYYLPQIFGKNHYSILASPSDMINTLTKLYHRIQSGR